MGLEEVDMDTEALCEAVVQTVKVFDGLLLPLSEKLVVTLGELVELPTLETLGDTEPL